MPNCTATQSPQTVEFGRLGRRVVEGRFDGGSMTLVATCRPAETVTGNRLASRRRLGRVIWKVFLCVE